jgi:hypothetical protein
MVEPQIVVLDVAGSSPVGHPILLGGISKDVTALFAGLFISSFPAGL